MISGRLCFPKCLQQYLLCVLFYNGNLLPLHQEVESAYASQILAGLRDLLSTNRLHCK